MGYEIVYTLGSGHCGSTLLNLLMNGHSQIIGLGELGRIDRCINSHSDGFEKASNFFNSDPFWQELSQRYSSFSSEDFQNLNLSVPRWREIFRSRNSEFTDYHTKNDTLFKCIQKVSGCKFLADSSKSAKRLFVLNQSPKFNIKVIYLVRDGRAVINSYIRKYESFLIALRRWGMLSLSAFYLKKLISSSDWLHIRYEDLATDPVQTLKKICDFLEIDFEKSMLKYRDHDYHGIGGNRMRYDNREEIYLDEQWKEELSLKHRVIFAIIGYWLNKLNGY